MNSIYKTVLYRTILRVIHVNYLKLIGKSHQFKFKCHKGHRKVKFETYQQFYSSNLDKRPLDNTWLHPHIWNRVVISKTTILYSKLCIQVLVFYYQNCSDLLWEKIVLVIEKSLKTFEIRGWRLRICKNFETTRIIYSNCERWSEQYLVTECFFNLFLEVSLIQ